MAEFSDELTDISRLPELTSHVNGIDSGHEDATKLTTKLTLSRQHCCVPKCTGDSRYNQELSFHRFPKDTSLKAEWISKIRRDEGTSFKITGNTRVCSRHSLESDYRPLSAKRKRNLKSGVVPSVFEWRGPIKQRRKIIHVDSGTQTDESDDEETYHQAMSPSESSAGPYTEEVDEPGELETLREAYKDAQKEIEELRAQVEFPKLYKFGTERFSNDNDDIKFYTGFLSYQHLCNFFRFIEPTAQHMSYVYSISSLQSRPARSLLLIDEFFLFLVRIRLGLFAQDLAHRFNISISSVSRKVTRWANYLYFVLGTQPIWPSREMIDLHMPQVFKDLYPKTRVILDCTEIYVQTPSSLLLQSQLYSSYKSNTTLKGLVGISPHGAITFVSSLYTGGVSDKEITRCSGSARSIRKR